MDLPFDFLENTFDSLKSGVIIYQPVRNEHNEIIDFVMLFKNKQVHNIIGNPLEELFETFKSVMITGEAANVKLQFSPDQFCDKHQRCDVEISKFQDGILAILHITTKPEDGILDAEKKSIEEQNLAAIFATKDAGIIIKSTENIIVDWNIGAENILGYSREEMMGKTTHAIAPSGDYEKIDMINDMMLRGEHISHQEVVRQHKNGSLVDCSLSHTPIYDKDAKITGSISIFHDITEQKATEKRNEELYNTMSNFFENISSAISIFQLVQKNDGTEDLKFITGNKLFAEFVSQPYDSLLGKYYAEVLPFNHALLPNYLSIAKTGTSHSYERYDSAFKRHLHVASFSPTYGQVAIIKTDRTAVVKAEAALVEQADDLRMIFSSITSGFCLCKIIRNDQGEAVDIFFEMVNTAYELMENYPPFSLQGKKLSEVSEDKNSPLLSLYTEATNQGKKVFQKQISALNITLEIICSSPKDDYFICVENDITDRVKAVEELQKAYIDTEMMFSEVDAPICVIGKQNSAVLSVNAAFCNLCSIDANVQNEEMGISAFFQSLVTYEGIPANMKDLICRQKNVYKMTKIDDTVIDVEVFSRPITYKEQEAIAIHCIDLTEQKRYEKVLQDAVLAAEDASKLKSAFIANMSHEIRTPMNGVIGFTELALDDGGISEKIRDYLNKIKISANGLLEIINDILDISKIEAGRMDLEKAPFMLHDILNQCETICHPKATEKGIMLYLYSEPGIGRSLLGDPTKLRQILLNLLTNAIKFTHAGVVKLMAVAEASDENTIRIRFEVKDSGIGITKDQIAYVFEAFAQGDNSTTRKFGGTGLGLSITKSLIELMGGKLEVESVVGLGSKFNFTLTFETTDEPIQVTYNEEALKAPLKKPVFKGEVLVCEDNVYNQQVIYEQLSRIGLGVTIASDGKIGVDMVYNRMLAGNPFEIIFMDIHMPIMDGLEATKKLQEIGNKAPIIALTANTMAKDREKYLSHGMSDYIGKPFGSPQLWSCLLKYLIPVDFLPIFSSGHSDGVDSKNGVTQSVAINRKLGIERSAYDEGVYNKLLRSFKKSFKYVVDNIRSEVSLGNLTQAHYYAHNLKSGAGTIGATELADAAYVIESSVSGMEATFTNEQIESLERALCAVMQELSSLSEEQEIKYDETAALDIEKATQLVQKLLPLLESFDAQCLEFLDEVKSTLHPIGENFTNLVKQMETCNFGMAFETLNNIKNDVIGRTVSNQS